jgi:Meiotically up-regulated gene 113
MFARTRRGRPRKAGPRYPSGDLQQPEPPFPGKAAVYVIELAAGIVKIGYSKNPASRINDLLGAREQPAALICSFWMDAAIAFKIEQKVHRKLQKTSVHARGEMYYLDAEAAIAIIKAIIGKQQPVEIAGLEQFTPEAVKGPRRHQEPYRRRNLPHRFSVF